MTLMQKEIFEQPKALATIKKTNESTIKALCTEIAKRDIRYCYFAARGTSDHASIYTQYLLGTYVGVPSALATPSVITAYDGKLCLKDSIVFGVSQSGKAADALAVMERGKKCGAITVAVTNDEASPMAKAADYHLFCNAGPEKSVAATKTFTAQMYVLALLVAEWSKNEELSDALEAVPGTLNEFIDTLSEKIDSIITRYRFMTEGFTLGRGYNYPIALENALKLQETNYVKMKGAAVSDFHHGPFAQVEANTIAILYADKGPVYKDAVEMLYKLENAGAEVLLISDDPVLCEGRELSIKMPNLGTDAVSVFFNAVFAQLFACKLAALKGRNPDEPRNLKKVTITK
ncbi:MAG: SIS domain-containing protein [Oscillospiraceae bacterium]|nr:SIS domain-containing protein [Oscillospiraceae bacterium]